MTLENVPDLTYLGYVIQETLRLNPTSVTTTPYYFEKDTKLGKLNVRANTGILVNIQGLHRNAKHWQRPTEFLPERFDPGSELSKTPSG